MTFTQILVAVFVAATDGISPATIDLTDGHRIVEGQEFALKFERDGKPAGGVRVTAKYRENAHKSLQQSKDLGETDVNGELLWTPIQAGVVVLTWEGGSKNVAVRHDGAPGLGVTVMILAGVLLLGGTFCFFVQMIRRAGPSDDTN